MYSFRGVGHGVGTLDIINKMIDIETFIAFSDRYRYCYCPFFCYCYCHLYLYCYWYCFTSLDTALHIETFPLHTDIVHLLYYILLLPFIPRITDFVLSRTPDFISLDSPLLDYRPSALLTLPVRSCSNGRFSPFQFYRLYDVSFEDSRELVWTSQCSSLTVFIYFILSCFPHFVLWFMPLFLWYMCCPALGYYYCSCITINDCVLEA